MNSIRYGMRFEESILVLTAYYGKTVRFSVCRYDREEYIASVWADVFIDLNDLNCLIFKSRLNRMWIEALTAKRMLKIPTRYDQLQTDEEGRKCLAILREHYKENPYGFELCAKEIVEKMDEHFQNFELTRPWRDGGRNALGYYVVHGDSHHNIPLKIDCALEAKCYAESNSVGVKQMSRLISRIRYRQFGIMVTTSFVDNQAYKEVVEDGHPILIISATDIAATLRKNAITSSRIDDWLMSFDNTR